MKVVVQLSNFGGELDRTERDFIGEADPDAVDEFVQEQVNRWTISVGDTIRVFATDEDGEEVDEDAEDEDDEDLDDEYGEDEDEP